MSTFDKVAGRGQSASTESLPGSPYRGSSLSSSTMPKKRRQSACFAQANFRAQALENQPLSASPLTLSHTADVRDALFQETKHLLLRRDNWPDDAVTEANAWRLVEAMIRLGVDNLDNLVTEASRINCGNMTITATLLSAVVATLFSTTYTDNSTHGRRAANGLFATSLFLSLATGIASFLAMEWLAWSTSQELRTESAIYRMMTTPMRSALMHSAIFSFFAGLLVLLWEVTPPAVYVMPTIISFGFGLYYVAATLRPIYLTACKGIGQYDSIDGRGLRVQVWTPFSVGTQRLANYIAATVIHPIQEKILRALRSFGDEESMQTKDVEVQ